MKTPKIDLNSESENSGIISGVNSGTIAINKGLSMDEALQIATYLFENNFPRLRDEAMVIAKQRAEEIARETFTEIITMDLNKIVHLSDPDIQYNLIRIEESYARYGKQDLKKNLIALFEKRYFSENEREMLLLNEAIRIVPSLTSSQMDILAVYFILDYAIFNISNLQQLIEVLERYILPLIAETNFDYRDVSHLVSFNCGAKVTNEILGAQLNKKFNDVFNIPKINAYNVSDYQKLLIECNGAKLTIKDYIIENTSVNNQQNIRKLFDVYDNFHIRLHSLGIIIASIRAETRVNLAFDISNVI